MESANKIFYILLLLFLSVVVSVSTFFAKPVEKLWGKYTAVERPTFNLEDWLSGAYQLQMDKRTNSRFFLRSVLIKTRNQIDFDWFDKSNTGWIVKGKDKMLLDKKYIASYLGQNFIGEDSIDHRVARLQFLQDTLLSRGKQLLLVIAPNKAALYPEYFPLKYKNVQKKLSTYDYYIDQLKKYDIAHVDLNKMFVEMKDTLAHPLYSKQGTHWNNYAHQFAWNSIVDSLEQDTDWNLARLIPGKINLEKPKGSDLDLEHLLNVFTLRDTSKSAYVDYTVDTTNTDRPSGLVIADSYFWGLRRQGFSKYVLNDGMYWYYNNTAFYTDDDLSKPTQQYDFNKVIDSVDIVMMLATAANLDVFPFGFAEDFYEAMQKPLSKEELMEQEKEILRMIERIRKNEEWYGDLKRDAIEKRQPLDSLVRVAAVYFLKQAKEKEGQEE